MRPSVWQLNDCQSVYFNDDEESDETLEALQSLYLPCGYTKITEVCQRNSSNHRSVSVLFVVAMCSCYFFFMSHCVWRACFTLQQALWPNLTPLFGSHCGLFLCSSHDPTRTVHGFNNLDSRDVAPLLPVFLFANFMSGAHAGLFSLHVFPCFLFSSQQSREWRGGILAVCGVCSNREISSSSTGSLSSSCWTSLSAVGLTMS